MGWFLVSIVLPLIAPILGMFVLQRLPLAVSDNDKHFLLPFKDGQLCWGALAFCASAMYEIAVPGEGGSLVVGDMVHWLDSGFIFLLTASALIAAGGAVFPTAIRPVNRHNWYKHYQSMAMSFTLTFLAGIGYCMVHFGVFKP